MNIDTEALAEIAASIKVRRRLRAEQEQLKLIQAARQIDIYNTIAAATNTYRTEHPEATWADAADAGGRFLTEVKQATRSGATTLPMREAPAPVKPIPTSANVWRLEERTLAVLQNFAEINPSVVIKPGNVIRSINPGTARVVAKAVVPQVFDRNFSIYQILPFLGSLKRFDDPVLIFDDADVNGITIREGDGRDGGTIRYPLADPGKIAFPSDKEPRFDVNTAFDIPRAALIETLAFAKLLSLRLFVVAGDGTTVTLSAEDIKEESHRSRMVIGKTAATYKIMLLVANVEKLAKTDYHVDVGFRGMGETLEGIARFTAVDAETTYWVAVEAESKPVEAAEPGAQG
jgi:hypothetical protein